MSLVFAVLVSFGAASQADQDPLAALGCQVPPGEGLVASAVVDRGHAGIVHDRA